MAEQNNNQDKILELLKTDSQAAMVRIVEEYTGLIWKIAERYLHDPEDIKECVNDTFLEFYTHQDRFDPAKGTMKAFLAVIARNVSVSRYRKNRSRSAEPLAEDIPDDRDEIQNADEKLDLEKALSVLKPQDAEMIRMKYYGGMTLQEIAESMHLPYETVKKRHQRSLGKMRIALIAGLVLLIALLAACAYAVARHFGILPGLGVIDTQSVSAPVYGLAKQASAKTEAAEGTIEGSFLASQVSAETEAGVYTVESGYLVGDQAVLRGSVHYKSDDPSTWGSTLESETSERMAMLLYGETEYACATNWSSYDADRDFSCVTWHMELPERSEQRLEFTLCVDDARIPLVFCSLEPGAAGMEGYSSEMGEYGGLMTSSHLKNGNLMVDIYPLNVDGYTFSNSLMSDFAVKYSGPAEDITLRAADGSERVGEIKFGGIQGVSGVAEMLSMDFGAVEPGEYTLHVPYVLLREAIDPPQIPVNLAECSWEDREYQFPGARITITDCKKLEPTGDEKIVEDIEMRPEGPTEGLSYWLLTMKYREMPEDEGDVTVLPCQVQMECPDIAQDIFGRCGFQPVNAEGENYQLLVWIEDEKCDISQFKLTTSDYRVLKWNRSFEIPVTAEPEL